MTDEGRRITSADRAPRTARVIRHFVAAALALLASCDKPPPPSPPSSAPAEIWKEFSGDKAFEHVRKQVSFGPRHSGSPALENARGHILETLKSNGWEVERQEFDAEPVPGKGVIRHVNVIGRYPSPAKRNTQRALVGSHYDTKRMEGFVGANDGGSSTGALLELSRVLATDPAFAAQIELVFFDGEEAIEAYGDPITGTDGLVGSRHYAMQLRDSGRAKQMILAIVWDMIGDRELKLTLPRDTPAEIAGGLYTAAEKLGLRNYIGYYDKGPSVLDDHVPIARIARVPAVDMIDFDYPHWHTVADLPEELSADSLRIVAQLTLWYLKRELSK